ncbi:HAD-IA family hydrolase [Luteococcus sp. Sow4_B9]|uniref:HAD-IA family hydrolase n=1 Tax=Luteococcus sp. Sow4_B9 TaxID=3438792 RepID=UPI003F9AE3B5
MSAANSHHTNPHLLVDMDGTLVDSTAVVESTWQAFAARHGLDAAEVIAFAHGRPTSATTHHFLADEELAAHEASTLQQLEEEAVDGIVEVPGAASFITSLDPQAWVLVTSAGRTLATNRMGIAGVPVPPHCVFAEDITHGKPDPQPYLLGAERLGVAARDCIALEDSPAGVRSAAAAGARVVVVGQLTDFDGEFPRIPDFRGLTLDALARLARG